MLILRLYALTPLSEVLFPPPVDHLEVCMTIAWSTGVDGVDMRNSLLNCRLGFVSDSYQT